VGRLRVVHHHEADPPGFHAVPDRTLDGTEPALPRLHIDEHDLTEPIDRSGFELGVAVEDDEIDGFTKEPGISHMSKRELVEQRNQVLDHLASQHRPTSLQRNLDAFRHRLVLPRLQAGVGAAVHHPSEREEAQQQPRGRAGQEGEDDQSHSRRG
jgi:hypothetical protein